MVWGRCVGTVRTGLRRVISVSETEGPFEVFFILWWKERQEEG